MGTTCGVLLIFQFAKTKDVTRVIKYVHEFE